MMLWPVLLFVLLSVCNLVHGGELSDVPAAIAANTREKSLFGPSGPASAPIDQTATQKSWKDLLKTRLSTRPAQLDVVPRTTTSLAPQEWQPPRALEPQWQTLEEQALQTAVRVLKRNLLVMLNGAWLLVTLVVATAYMLLFGYAGTVIAIMLADWAAVLFSRLPKRVWLEMNPEAIPYFWLLVVMLCAQSSMAGDIIMRLYE